MSRLKQSEFPSQRGKLYLRTPERWQSGRMRRFAKPLYGLTPVPRVRIPPSPPVQQVTAALSLRNWDETMAYKTAIRLFSHERGLLASLVESRTYFWRQVKNQTP